MNLEPKEVESRYDIELLRSVRNDCANYMTRHREIISAEQQQQWWKTLDKKTWKVFVYWYGDMIIGFGVLRLEDGKYWVTGGLTERYRGYGFGKQLFNHLIGLVPYNIWLEVLASNNRAWKLYEKLGFCETGRKDGIITMVLIKTK